MMREVSHVCKLTIQYRPVIRHWWGSTSRMRVIGESRNANLPSQTRLVAVSLSFFGWGKAPIRPVYWLNQANWRFIEESL